MVGIVSVSFLILFATLAIGIVTYLIQIARLFGLLSDRHPQVYQALGSPSVVFNNTLRNNAAVLGWLWRREFEGLGDPDTISRCSGVRTLLIGCLGGFSVLVLLFPVMGVLIRA